MGVNRVVVDTLGYCRVLCGTVGVLHGTAGYCWLLLGTGWYWGALKCTRGTVEYCGVLQGTAGHCWTLLGSARYCMVLLRGTRCILGEGGVLGVLWDTARYYGYWGYLGLLRGNLRYCGLL